MALQMGQVKSRELWVSIKNGRQADMRGKQDFALYSSFKILQRWYIFPLFKNSWGTYKQTLFIIQFPGSVHVNFNEFKNLYIWLRKKNILLGFQGRDLVGGAGL